MRTEMWMRLQMIVEMGLTIDEARNEGVLSEAEADEMINDQHPIWGLYLIWTARRWYGGVIAESGVKLVVDAIQRELQLNP